MLKAFTDGFPVCLRHLTVSMAKTVACSHPHIHPSLLNYHHLQVFGLLLNVQQKNLYFYRDQAIGRAAPKN